MIFFVFLDRNGGNGLKKKLIDTSNLWANIIKPCLNYVLNK